MSSILIGYMEVILSSLLCTLGTTILNDICSSVVKPSLQVSNKQLHLKPGFLVTLKSSISLKDQSILYMPHSK